MSLFVPVKCHQHRAGVEYHCDAQSIYLVVWWQLVIMANIVLGETQQWGRPTSDKEPRPDGHCAS